jgi:hypothetical protein
MKNTEGSLHFFTYASKEKHNRTIKNSVSVIEKCISLTGKIDVHHHIKYAETQERDRFLNYLTESVDQGIVDIIYTATTSIPPISVLENFNEQLPTDLKQRRDPDRTKLTFSHSGKLHHPFINIDKKEIANMYKELNLLDSLFPITGSCESLQHPTGHCGRCWWCQERSWAFGKT